MDIEILLFLQEFRSGPGKILADFLLKMTFLSEVSSVLVILAVVYWCVDKNFGTYLLMGWSGNRLVNGFLKVTACVYRPWIRDARILPYGDSMKTATGYSFPSGHTMNAASVYGGPALRKELPKALRITLASMVVLVAFSRNYLGVHTPQDVLVGAVAGLSVMWAAGKMMRYLEKEPGKEVLLLVLGLCLAAAIAVYAYVKPYPIDYNEAGELIVDGAEMANDTFKGIGWCSAFLIGWFLEKCYVGFTTKLSMEQRISRMVCGLLGYYAGSLILVPLIKTMITGPAGTVISCFLQMFYISFLFPLMMKRLESRKEKDK